jgi:type IV secretory pathway VirB2 component (pilin)
MQCAIAFPRASLTAQSFLLFVQGTNAHLVLRDSHVARSTHCAIATRAWQWELSCYWYVPAPSVLLDSAAISRPREEAVFQVQLGKARLAGTGSCMVAGQAALHSGAALCMAAAALRTAASERLASDQSVLVALLEVVLGPDSQTAALCCVVNVCTATLRVTGSGGPDRNPVLSAVAGAASLHVTKRLCPSPLRGLLPPSIGPRKPVPAKSSMACMTVPSVEAEWLHHSGIEGILQVQNLQSHLHTMLLFPSDKPNCILTGPTGSASLVSIYSKGSSFLLG